MPRKQVLIAGASGLVGYAAMKHFGADPDCDVIALSRRTPDDKHGARFLPLDLTDAAACRPACARACQTLRIWSMPPYTNARDWLRAGGNASRSRPMTGCCATCSTRWSGMRKSCVTWRCCRAPRPMACMSGRWRCRRAKTARRCTSSRTSTGIRNAHLRALADGQGPGTGRSCGPC